LIIFPHISKIKLPAGSFSLLTIILISLTIRNIYAMGNLGGEYSTSWGSTTIKGAFTVTESSEKDTPLLTLSTCFGAVGGTDRLIVLAYRM
jgi:hypothetical protein